MLGMTGPGLGAEATVVEPTEAVVLVGKSGSDVGGQKPSSR